MFGARIVLNPQRVDSQTSVEMIPGDSCFSMRCSPRGVSETPQGELRQLALRFAFFFALFPMSQIWPQMSQNTIDVIPFFVEDGQREVE